MNILNNWHVPLYVFQHDEHDSLLDQLRQVCYGLQERQDVSGVAPGAKSNLYESSFDFFLLEDPAVKQLMSWCRDSVFEAAKHANNGRWNPGSRIGVDIHESWCHITQPGGYHDMHIHPNSAWSAIYYLQAGESDLASKSGCNRFFSPWISAYSDISTRWSSEVSSVDLPPTDGQMVVFPSWLPHSALPYHGTTDRLVIAFNCKFIDGGSGTITLDVK
jgi:uncharacterized protein (TIGR02466 family)